MTAHTRALSFAGTSDERIHIPRNDELAVEAVSVVASGSGDETPH